MFQGHNVQRASTAEIVPIYHNKLAAAEVVDPRFKNFTTSE